MTNLLLAAALVLLPAAGPCDDSVLKRRVKESEIVVVAEVEEVGPPPPHSIWSGLMFVTQRVKYRVRTVLKGDFSEPDVWVSFGLVYGSLTVEKDAPPQLSAALFKEKSLHLVFISPERKSDSAEAEATPERTYHAPDVNCGALIATPAMEAKIRRLASKP